MREACITIAFLSQTMRNKLDHFAESVLPHLINLIPSSTKVMASSGFVAVRFIVSNTHGTRLIPIFANALSQSKAKEIRRACCEFVEQIMSTWPPHTLERHANIIQEAIKKGIADADPEARLCSRRSVSPRWQNPNTEFFAAFSEHSGDSSRISPTKLTVYSTPWTGRTSGSFRWRDRRCPPPVRAARCTRTGAAVPSPGPVLLVSQVVPRTSTETPLTWGWFCHVGQPFPCFQSVTQVQ